MFGIAISIPILGPRPGYNYKPPASVTPTVMKGNLRSCQFHEVLGVMTSNCHDHLAQIDRLQLTSILYARHVWLSDSAHVCTRSQKHALTTEIWVLTAKKWTKSTMDEPTILKERKLFTDLVFTYTRKGRPAFFHFPHF